MDGDLASAEEGDIGSGRQGRKSSPDLVVVGGRQGATTATCGQKQVVDPADAIVNPVAIDPIVIVQEMHRHRPQDVSLPPAPRDVLPPHCTPPLLLSIGQG
jgi:hypothetical protein